MAIASDAVWAIDLGNRSLKALHLMAVGESVQVIGFDNVPHGKILSSGGISAAERDELIAISLRQFVQRNDVGFDPLIISVPSQSSFARFVTLPPVEAKRVPEIVRFEAAQQIPFDMSEIQWDWMLMSDPEDPEKRVGLFAIKNEVVDAALEHFEREDLQVSWVQMAPMALYNFLLHDRPDLVSSDKKATVIVNIGAETTDLVVCTASGVWQRCILMGGNAFTQAIAETFKLSFEKAEKLKRTAPVSKYARQIFQAMRPVFTDWTGEIQRSLGFYTNSNPDVKLARVVAMGGGTRLRGLLKYLQQTLQIPVEKPDAFKRLVVAQGISAAKFHENVSDFGVVYGLGLQGLGMARIESNLLPKSIARSMAWATKTKYFIAAAAIVFFASLLCLGRQFFDQVGYARNASIRSQNNRVETRAEQRVQSTQGLGDQKVVFEERMREQFKLFEHREVIPRLHEILISALPNAQNNPEQRALYEAFAQGDVARVMQVPRSERKQLFLTHVSVYFSDNLERAQFGASAMKRRDAMMRSSETGGEGGAYEDQMMAEMMEIYGAEYMQQYGGDMFGMGEEEEKDAGFVVTLVGYSPYKDVGALLDPPNVRDRPDKWGLVTRLENLDEFLDVNVPFDLYSRESQQFRLQRHLVEKPFENIPIGVGEEDYLPDPDAPRAGPGEYGMGMGMSINRENAILIDPLTKERIDAVPLEDRYGNPKYDAMGNPVRQPRDSWFELQFKLRWTEAPEDDAAGGGAMGAPAPY